MITVIDVFRELNIEPTPEVTWAVGAHVRDLWSSRNEGQLPPKVLRTKTSGVGSHCFATYPRSMRDEIVAVINAHVTEESRQHSMFCSDHPWGLGEAK